MTKGNWVSGNYGTLFLSDHSWWAVRQGYEVSVYSSVDINKHIRFNTKYVYTHSTKVPKLFSGSQSDTPENVFDGEKYHTDFGKLEFLFNYTF